MADPNWHLFFRFLLSDRIDGKEMTWFSAPQLWWLRNEIMWRPARSGCRPIGKRELGRLSIGQAMTLLRWGNKKRKTEAEQYRRAIEEARAGRK